MEMRTYIMLDIFLQESSVSGTGQEQAVQPRNLLDAYEQDSRSKIFTSGCKSFVRK